MNLNVFVFGYSSRHTHFERCRHIVEIELHLLKFSNWKVPHMLICVLSVPKVLSSRKHNTPIDSHLPISF